MSNVFRETGRVYMFDFAFKAVHTFLSFPLSFTVVVR